MSHVNLRVERLILLKFIFNSFFDYILFDHKMTSSEVTETFLYSKYDNSNYVFGGRSSLRSNNA